MALPASAFSPLADAELDTSEVVRVVSNVLGDADDGELFLEFRQSENLVFDDGRLKSAATDFARGFGLRAVAGEAVGYAYSSDLSIAALERAASAVGAVTRGYSGTLAGGGGTSRRHQCAPLRPRKPT